MASTFSPNLRIELIGAGEQSGAWNNTTNTNLGTLIEQAISGVQEITLGGGNYTLEAANGAEDEARNMVLIINPDTASRNIIAPDVDKVYIVRNTDTVYAHTIKTASGSGVSVPPNSSALVFCDGTGNGTFYNAVDDLAADATIGGVPIATTTGTQTLSNKTLTAPKFVDGGFIADANGNEIVVLDTVTSAVNEITVANAATGAGPSISATGSDTNIDLLLVSKGTGTVKAGGNQVATVSTNTFTSNQIISVTDNTNAALRVTQLGTGNAILVEDSSNPDGSPFVIDTNGRATVGYTLSVPAIGGVPAGLGVHGDSTVGNNLSVFRWSNDSIGSFLTASKSRGTTAGTQTMVSSGDNIGALLFTASDGTNFLSAARIDASVDGTPGTNDMPGRIVFSTTADGASTVTERFRIGSAGQLGVAGANYGTSGQVLTSGGASAAPTWANPVTLTVGTPVTLSGQTAANFTSIPAGVNRITVTIFNVVTAGGEWLMVQLGTSSGYVTSGYAAGSFTQGGNNSFSDAFSIRNSGSGQSGTMTLVRVSGNNWVASHALTDMAGGGRIALSGTLDRVRLTSGSTLNSGIVNILYE